MSEYVQYQDMTLKEIEKTFEKSQAAVSMAVKRMLDRNPEHQDWKYREGKTVKIKAEGVLWLAENYFITPFEISNIDPEKIRLEEENKYLKALISAMKEQYQDKLYLELEKQALKLNSERLLELKELDILKANHKLEIEKIQSENDRLLDAVRKDKDSQINYLNNLIKKERKESNDRVDELAKELDRLKNRSFLERLLNKK